MNNKGLAAIAVSVATAFTAVLFRTPEHEGIKVLERGQPTLLDSAMSNPFGQGQATSSPSPDGAASTGTETRAQNISESKAAAFRFLIDRAKNGSGTSAEKIKDVVLAIEIMGEEMYQPEKYGIDIPELATFMRTHGRLALQEMAGKTDLSNMQGSPEAQMNQLKDMARALFCAGMMDDAKYDRQYAEGIAGFTQNQMFDRMQALHKDTYKAGQQALYTFDENKDYDMAQLQGFKNKAEIYGLNYERYYMVMQQDTNSDTQANFTPEIDQTIYWIDMNKYDRIIDKIEQKISGHKKPSPPEPQAGLS